MFILALIFSCCVQVMERGGGVSNRNEWIGSTPSPSYVGSVVFD